jgi:DNA-binding transcriptional MerR regulator
MPDTRAEAAYLRSVTAFKDPTLRLLHGRYAQFVIAMLSIMFTADRPAVAVSDAHAELGEAVDQLRAGGYEDDDRKLPSGSAREICRYWVQIGWLVPQIENDVEVYRLSAHAVGALEIAGRTDAGAGRVSRSRVRSLLDAVDRLSRDAEADPEQRIALLTAERDALDAEIARLSAGGVEPVDDEQLLEEAENVLHLARELPADFARVAESIKAMQRDVVADLRRDVRPTGEILREYLQRGQHVMQSTAEGRAFEGALRLIGDPDHSDRLADQLHTLLVQPFSRLMSPGQRSELDAIGRRVEQGVQEVLTAQRRASQVITSQVRTHDAARDRQVDELLRAVMSGLHEWMQTSKSGERVEPLRGFPTADIGHLRQTVSDLRPPSTPVPLAAPDDDETPMADARAWGGPRYRELEDYVTTLGDMFDLASAFDGAGDEIRRPVDLVGLLEIAHRNGMTDGDAVSVVETLRPDGTTRRFAFANATALTVKETELD